MELYTLFQGDKQLYWITVKSGKEALIGFVATSLCRLKYRLSISFILLIGLPGLMDNCTAFFYGLQLFRQGLLARLPRLQFHQQVVNSGLLGFLYELPQCF